MDHDIVITGNALACSLGLTRDEVFKQLRAGKCGSGSPLPDLESKPYVESGGGQAPPLPTDFYPNHPRETRYLRHVALDALREAHIDGIENKQVGAIVGSTLHGIRGLGRYLRTGSPRNLLDIPAGDTLSRAFDGLGVDALRITNCSACSSGLSSLSIASDLLRTGMIDVAIAGGYDPIAEYSHAGFASLRLIASGHCTPFCVDREGMKAAEGYGLVVLERHDDAVARNATIWAHLSGTGETSDVHHLTQPDPEGKGASAALRRALKDADIQPTDIDLIVAHATGTPANDHAEHAALHRIFGEHLGHIPTIPFKANLGHTLGGAGAIELILSLMCRSNRIIPPTANLSERTLEVSPLKVVVEEEETCTINHSAQVSMGFGGANACVVLSSQAPATRSRRQPKAQVVLTGIGVFIPGAAGNESFIDLLAGNINPSDNDHPNFSDHAKLLRGKRVRRMSEQSKLSIAATSLAYEHAQIENIEAFGENASALLGTFAGGADYSEKYYSQIVKEGLGAGNPMLFAEGVPNAAAAQLGMAFGIRGGCQSITGSTTAGLDALALAVLRIEEGVWTQMIVSAADEKSDLTAMGFRVCDKANADVPIGSGAVSLILETAESAQARGATPIAVLSNPCLGYINSENDSLCDAFSQKVDDQVQAIVGTSSKSMTAEQSYAKSLGVKHYPLSNKIGTNTLSASPLLGVAAAALGAKISNSLIPSISSVLATDGSGSVSSVCVKRSFDTPSGGLVE